MTQCQNLFTFGVSRTLFVNDAGFLEGLQKSSGHKGVNSSGHLG